MRSSPYWPVLYNPQAVPVGGLTEVPSRELVKHCWTRSVCVCQTTGQHALWQEATQLTVSLDLVEAATPCHMLVSLIKAQNGHKVCDATSIHWQAVGGRQAGPPHQVGMSVESIHWTIEWPTQCNISLCRSVSRETAHPHWTTVSMLVHTFGDPFVCPVPWLCNRFPISASHPAPPLATSGAGTG